MKIKNIIFDMDGVIRGIKNIPVKDIISKELIEKYPEYKCNLGVSDFIVKYLHLPCFKEWDKCLVSQETVLNEVLKIAEEPKEIATIIFNTPTKKEGNFLYEDTIQLINYLKEKGYKVYILSNMCKEIVDVLAEMIDFSKFDGVIFLCDVGLRKPDIEFYKYAINSWNVSFDESIFIDDRQSNLSPFTLLGGKTYLFDPTKIDESINELKYYIEHN